MDLRDEYEELMNKARDTEAWKYYQLYDQYKKSIEVAERLLEELQPKWIITTSDHTEILREEEEKEEDEIED